MNTEEQERIDHFEKLRSELADPDDEALRTRLQELCHQVMEPAVELACTHITSSIGRPVLLCMGIGLITTHAMVENVLNAGLLGKGTGHVVLHLSGRDGIDTRAVAATITDDPAVMARPFEER